MPPGIESDPPDDDAGNAIGCRSEQPTLVGSGADECRIYVPEASSLHGAASNGNDIGANIVDQLLDGIPTGEPLWNDDGSFPCGPDPREPAQIDDEACPDLARRVGLGDACPPPPASD